MTYQWWDTVRGPEGRRLKRAWELGWDGEGGAVHREGQQETDFFFFFF